MPTAFMERIIHLTDKMFKDYETKSKRKDWLLGKLKDYTSRVGRDTELSADKREESMTFSERIMVIAKRNHANSSSDSNLKELVDAEIVALQERLDEVYTKHQADKATLEDYIELYQQHVNKIFDDYENLGLLDISTDQIIQDAYLTLVLSLTHYLISNSLKNDPLYYSVNSMLGSIRGYARDPVLAKEKADMVRVKLICLRRELVGHYVNTADYNHKVLDCAKIILIENQKLIQKRSTKLTPSSLLPKPAQFFTDFLSRNTPFKTSLVLSKSEGELKEYVDEAINNIESLTPLPPAPYAQPVPECQSLQKQTTNKNDSKKEEEPRPVQIKAQNQPQQAPETTPVTKAPVLSAFTASTKEDNGPEPEFLCDPMNNPTQAASSQLSEQEIEFQKLLAGHIADQSRRNSL